MKFRWTDRRKKKILFDIIANVEEKTSLKEIQEDFRDGTDVSVSMELVKEAAIKMDKEGKITLKEENVHPKEIK